MTQRYAMLFRYDDTIREGLEAIKARDGVPYNVQVRLAMLAWLSAKGVGPTPARVSDRLAALAARLDALVTEANEATRQDAGT